MNNIIYLFLIITHFSFCQQTKKYDSLASLLKPLDTIQIVDNFKNGKIRETGTSIKYEFEGELYEFYTGKILKYYKNGRIRSEIECNSFGCELKSKHYDSSGLLISESLTTKIDIKGNHVIDFLELKKNHLVYGNLKLYIYSMKLDDIYLKSEGKFLNEKKIGRWVKYFRDGSIKGESTYK